jgi:hypothetical protein
VSAVPLGHEEPCKLCADTGWITRAEDGPDSLLDAYEIPCPMGCPGVNYTAADVFEVPF